MTVKLKDVARICGVSTATVSQALNHGPVSKETRIKVQENAERLGYQPSLLARGLRHRRTNIIALALPWSNVELIDNVIRTAARQGYQVIIQQFAENQPAEEKRTYDNLLRLRVDGVLLVPAESGLDYGRVVEGFRRYDIPLVFLDKHFDGLQVDSFLFDNFGGALLGARHLLRLGRQPVRFLGHSQPPSNVQRRLEGVKEAYLMEHKPWDPSYFHKVVEPDGSFLEKELLLAMEQDRGRGALFAATDHIAYAIIRLAKKHKFHIPKDFSLLGFEDLTIGNNLAIGEYLSPSLSTIRMHFDRVAREATAFLLNLISIPKTAKHPRSFEHLIPPEIIVRESCGGKPPGPANFLKGTP